MSLMAHRRAKKAFSYLWPCGHKCIDKTACRHVCCAPQGVLADLPGFEDFFSSPELMLMVLDRVPNEHVLNLRLVSKGIQNFVDNTASLQRALMLRPESSPTSMITEMQVQADKLAAEGRLGNPGRHVDFWPVFTARKLEINELLVRNEIGHPLSNGSNHCVLQFVKTPNLAGNNISLFKDMYITQPPVQEAWYCLGFQWRRGNRRGTDICTSFLVVRNGIKWQNIINQVFRATNDLRATRRPDEVEIDMIASCMLIPGLRCR